METSLYGDQDYTAVYRLPQMDSVQQMKKRMTLDLDVRPGKRQRTDQLLTSPDINMLKLASPELERFITQHGLATTPTPGPQAISAVFGRTVTEEQENYARGFVDALHHLKQQEQEGGGLYAADAFGGDPSPVYTTLESSGAGPMPVASTAVASLPGQQYYGLPGGQFEPVHIKEEPQTVPSVSSHASSPQPPSPVDMAEQERIKLERKRLRNRIAATKCRKRKLERIARLEDRVRQIKSENSELAAVAGRLREQVMALKKEVQQHSQNGCQILPPR
ncbi:LOW QUALITY PROTEIN: transcription factor jun-D-like [Pollicipes pollicipes]|uniref:LOW QUALITY PROTEIN: transcription factor jun-D-like n=1 Tax=Pollicipes pollicipes TaxID=41117 RepID=UPI001884B310|nr:LOW QUALITY PROTEIN: transcription factor jun-D-like [Pollicipes pollicipes]